MAKKLTRKQGAWIYLNVMVTLLLWLLKGWKYGIGYFLIMSIAAQFRILLFVRDKDA